ncbi:hypothetical protein LC593_05035 [Nostoc sp. CHAB 5844]|nr:hypothetical protein [Nostoc sp. CHAB 5844]
MVELTLEQTRIPYVLMSDRFFLTNRQDAEYAEEEERSHFVIAVTN